MYPLFRTHNSTTNTMDLLVKVMESTDVIVTLALVRMSSELLKLDIAIKTNTAILIIIMIAGPKSVLACL